MNNSRERVSAAPALVVVAFLRSSVVGRGPRPDKPRAVGAIEPDAAAQRAGLRIAGGVRTRSRVGEAAACVAIRGSSPDITGLVMASCLDDCKQERFSDRLFSPADVGKRTWGTGTECGGSPWVTVVLPQDTEQHLTLVAWGGSRGERASSWYCPSCPAWIEILTL